MTQSTSTQFPGVPNPTVLSGLFLCASALSKSRMARFTTAVAQGGGTCHENVTQFTSVLVCGSVQSSKFAKCKEHNIPVVTLSWLEETVKTGVRQPFTAHAMQAFTGVTLTTTGIFETEEERSDAEKTVTALGGKLLGDLLVDRVTLLVAGKPDGPKIDAARAAGIQIVRASWFSETMKRKVPLAPQPYTISDSTPGRKRAHGSSSIPHSRSVTPRIDTPVSMPSASSSLAGSGSRFQFPTLDDITVLMPESPTRDVAADASTPPKQSSLPFITPMLPSKTLSSLPSSQSVQSTGSGSNSPSSAAVDENEHCNAVRRDGVCGAHFGDAWFYFLGLAPIRQRRLEWVVRAGSGFTVRSLGLVNVTHVVLDPAVSPKDADLLALKAQRPAPLFVSPEWLVTQSAKCQLPSPRDDPIPFMLPVEAETL